MTVFESVRKRNLFFFFLIVYPSSSSLEKKKACSQCEFFLWVINWTYIKLGQWFPPFPTRVCSYWMAAKLFTTPRYLGAEELRQIGPVQPCHLQQQPRDKRSHPSNPLDGFD